MLVDEGVPVMTAGQSDLMRKGLIPDFKKAGLDPAKIDWLLRSLAATSCPMSCPHGRPIALRYSTRDILRSFHRI